MKTKRMQLISTVILCLYCSSLSNAQQTLKEFESSKGPMSRDVVSIERIDNDRADFAVLVEVNRANYSEGDKDLVARLKSSRSGFVYLVHISSSGKTTMLIPNKFQSDNRITANQVVEYPPKGANFDFLVTGPNFGRETIKAIVTDRPLTAIEVPKYAKSMATAIDVKDSEALLAELVKSKDIDVVSRTEDKPDSDDRKPEGRPITITIPEDKLRFATHQVSFTTRAKTQTQSQTQSQAQTAKPQRFVVCIAPEKYLDPKINDLSACVHDAKAFANLMVTKCGVHKDNCVVLVNEQVTLENVKKLFCEILPKIVPPGSEIIVYWSGHGGRMSSTRNDTSTTGYATYLVPHDGKLSDPENTMLMEGAFGHWVQNLNGRKLLFILDACYSGGVTRRAKSLDSNGPQSLAGAVSELTGGSKSIGIPEAGDEFEITFDLEDDFVFMFGFKSLARSKALGQNGLAVIASSSRDQLSWERNEGDLSVMTYFLIKAIEEGPRSMTHKDIKPAVSKAVDKYIQDNHPNTRQTVVEQDDLTPGMVMKP